MRYDFDLGYLLENMPWFLQLPLLEEMNVWINARSLATLIPRTNNTGLGEGRNGYCSRHKGYIGKSQVFHEMAEFRDGVADLLDGGPHLAFRFHMTQKALLRTHDRVTRDHPSLRARSMSNNLLGLCHNHLVLGSCELVTCRILFNWKSVLSCQYRNDRHESRANAYSKAITKILKRDRHSRRALMDSRTTTPSLLFPGISRT